MQQMTNRIPSNANVVAMPKNTHDSLITKSRRPRGPQAPLHSPDDESEQRYAIHPVPSGMGREDVVFFLAGMLTAAYSCGVRGEARLEVCPERDADVVPFGVETWTGQVRFANDDRTVRGAAVIAAAAEILAAWLRSPERTLPQDEYPGVTLFPRNDPGIVGLLEGREQNPHKAALEAVNSSGWLLRAISDALRNVDRTDIDEVEGRLGPHKCAIRLGAGDPH